MLLLGWWLVQMAQLFNPTTPTAQQVGNVVVDQAATAVEQGSVLNTLLVVAYALIGAWFIPRTLEASPGRALRTLVLLFCAYLIWALFSILWSVDQALTFRRVVQVTLLAVGSYGLGVGFYARTEHGRRLLASHVLVAGLTAMASLWVALFSTGSVNLLDPAFAAKSIGLGTAVAHPVALSLFAAVYLWRRRVLNAGLCFVYLGAALLALFAQKVRLISVYSTIVLLVALVARLNLKRAAPWLLAAGFVASVAVSVVAVSDTSRLSGTLDQFVTLDSGQDISDLSGRVELWAELQQYVATRPVLGYGFGAFWNPDNLHQVQEVISWAPVVAHNGYLDEVLATGLIGATVCLVFWVVGTLVALASARALRDDFAAMVACWIVLFLLFNWGDSILQLYFRFPFYVALTGLFALVCRRVSPEWRIARRTLAASSASNDPSATRRIRRPRSELPPRSDRSHRRGRTRRLTREDQGTRARS
jgi:exopolysaccharide production protein ExoQ